MESTINKLAKPPRRVSVLLLLQCFLGSQRNQFIWLFFAAGFGAFSSMGGLSCIENLIVFQGKKLHAAGKVTDYFSANTEIGNKPVFGMEYQFHSDDGETITDTSYKTGIFYKKNTPVKVEYIAQNPTYSRIEGARTLKAGMLPFFILFFPLIGAIGWIGSITSGIKRSWLLKKGIMTNGVLINKPGNRASASETVSDRKPEPDFVYSASSSAKKTYKFNDSKNSERTITIDIRYYQEFLPKSNEAILYDESNPDSAIIVDSIPASVIITKNGYFDLSNRSEKLNALRSLIIPFLAITVNAFLMYYQHYY